MKYSAIAITVSLFAAGCAVNAEDGVSSDSELATPRSSSLETVRGRIKEVYGPFSSRSSGRSWRDVYLEVPETYADHCVQNGGAGEFWDTSAGTGRLRREYRCSFLMTSAQDLAEHGFGPTTELSHREWSWIEQPYPEYRNPDQHSSRHWARPPVGEYPFGIEKHLYSYSQLSYYSGWRLPADRYKGSPAGRDGIYHVVEVTCTPKGFNYGSPDAPRPTTEDLEAQCSREEMIRIAKVLTTGPTEALASAR